jgi:hypothetical protein
MDFHLNYQIAISAVIFCCKENFFFLKKQLQMENSGFVKKCDGHVHRQLWREILNFQLDQCKPIREGSFHQSELQHFAHLNLTCKGEIP